MVKEERVYLGEILGRLQKASETLNYSYNKCQAIGFKTDAVLRNIQIIGEAARNIERSYPEFAQ